MIISYIYFVHLIKLNQSTINGIIYIVFLFSLAIELLTLHDTFFMSFI